MAETKGERERASQRRRSLVGLVVAALMSLVAGGARAGTCPVPLFREHSPASPPALLTDAPLLDIFDSPHVDADPRPPGTALSFYRVNRQTAEADPDFPLILLEKQGGAVSILWGGGSGDPIPCCVGAACRELCPPDCEAAGGTLLPPGVSCADDPPPCGVDSDCASASRPAFGLAKQAGGGVSFGGSGFPSLAAVDLNSVDTDGGAADLLPLTLDPEEERVWNFTGAQDPSAGLMYHAGGRAGHATIAATVVTVDTTSSMLVSALPLIPAVNLVHVDFDNETGTLYGLAAGAGNLLFQSGNVVFSGSLTLVTIDAATGTVTEVASSLPGGLRNFSATLDGVGRRYFYHTDLGELHAVDLDTGLLTTVAVPEILADLQFDDATGTLHGLETWGGTMFQGSGDDGYRSFGNIELLSLDPATGVVTSLNASPLPTGTTNYSSAFDCSSGHYLYVSETGEMQVLDVATGALLAAAAPPGSSRFHALD